MTSNLSVPDQVGSDEEFGRSIFDSKKAQDAARDKWHPRMFREHVGVREISFDRTSLADLQQLGIIHSKARPGKEFHGWAVIDYVGATSMNRTVVADKLPNNPWHANIVLPPLPDGHEAQEEEQKAHSASLARRVRWLSKPSSLTSENQEP